MKITWKINEPERVQSIKLGTVFTGSVNDSGSIRVLLKCGCGVVDLKTGKTWVDRGMTRGPETIFDYVPYPEAELVMNDVKKVKTILPDTEIVSNIIPSGMVFTGKIGEYSDEIFFKCDEGVVSLETFECWTFCTPKIKSYRALPDAEIRLV